MTPKLEDTWTRRDYPVLVAAARLLDEGTTTYLSVDGLAAATGLTEIEVGAALVALQPVYLFKERPPAQTSGSFRYVWMGDPWRLTERGRRTVGLWPSGESADALVDALRQAEEATEDPEEKTLLRRAAGAVGSVSRDIMVDVIAAVVSRQSGLG